MPQDAHNQEKHGVSFLMAQQAFFDPSALLLKISAIVTMKIVIFVLAKLTVEF